MTAVRRAGLLTGPKTVVRNFVGNSASAAFDPIARLPAALFDMAIGRYTGARTVNPVILHGSKRVWINSAPKSWQDIQEVMKTGMTASDLAKFDIPRELNVQLGEGVVGSKASQAMNGWVNYINRFQAAQDKPFRAYFYNRSLEEQAHLLARKEGLKGAQRAARINELVASPPEAMQLQVIADAEQAVFANSNLIADATSGAKRLLNARGVPGRAFAWGLDTLVPVVRTPTNIVGRVLESSPAGLLHTTARGVGAVATRRFSIQKLIAEGGLDAATQKQFSMAAGRGLSGSGLIILGYHLPRNGKLTGSYSNDRGVSGREEAVGNSPGSLIIGGQSYQIGDSPAGVLLIIGATLHRDTVEGKRPRDLPLAALSAAGKQVLDMPMLQGLSDAEASLRRPDTEGGRFFRGLAGSYVPSIVASAADAADSVQRSAETPLDAVKQRIPGLRGDLPARADALGRDVPAVAWWNPIEGRKQRDDALSKEIDRLDIRIQKPNRIRDPKSPLFDKSERDYQERIRIVGEEVRRSLERMIGAPWYKRADDDVKAKRLQAAISKAKARATERLKAKAERAKKEARAGE